MIPAKQLHTETSQRLQTLYEPEEARSIAYLLLQDLLGITKVEILAGKQVAIASVAAKWEKSLARLLQHEPIQYVLGHAWFYGRRFNVNPHVLIPRPETEELVDWICREQQTKAEKSPVQILDMGTGSGCIAITLAKELVQAQVFAVDVSPDALQTARQNAALYEANVNWIEADVLSYEQYPSLNKLLFDIVVSNPPYVMPGEKPLIHANVLEHEPHLALFVPEEDPLLFYRHIALYCQTHLKPGGVCYLEVNEKKACQVAELLCQYGFQAASIRVDLFKKDRFVKGIR